MFYHVGNSQSSTENRIREAIQYYLAGDLENAYQIFQSMENSPPLNKKFFVYYALTLKDLHYSNYGEWIDRGLKLFVDDPELKLLKVEWLADQTKFQAALKLLEELQSVLPKERYKKMASYLCYNQGVVLYKSGEKKKSARWFFQAHQLNPNEPRFIRNYAIVLAETGAKKQAQKVLEEYVRQYPTDDQMTKLLIQIYNETGETKKLGTLLKKNAELNGSVEDSLVLAQYYMYTGKVKNALNILRRIEITHPKDKRPFEIQLDFWKKQLQRMKMDSILTVMETKFPEDTTVLQLKLRNYLEMDSIKAANRVLKKMLQKDSLKFIYHSMILKNLERTDKKEWKKYLGKITHYPFPPKEMEEIAHEWFLGHEWEKALDIYRDLMMIHYETARLWTDIGIINLKKGEKDSAKIAFERAIRFKSERDYRSFFWISDIFLQEKDSISARLYFEIGMEVLLEKLGVVQKELVGRLQQSSMAIQETYRTRSMAEQNLELEQEMHRWISWFSEHFPPPVFEKFLQQFLARFPQNRNLRYILGIFYMKQKQYSRAKSLLEDVLYMDPKHIPARRKLIFILEKIENQKEKAFSLYREIFRIQPDSLTESDYLEMIGLSRILKQDQLLAQEWLLAFSQGYREKKFVKHLIEILHYTGFHEKAREVQEIVSKKKRWVQMNPLLEMISPTNSKRALP
jgi:Tfp pilus assembly protein PilF